MHITTIAHKIEQIGGRINGFIQPSSSSLDFVRKESLKIFQNSGKGFRFQSLPKTLPESDRLLALVLLKKVLRNIYYVISLPHKIFLRSFLNFKLLILVQICK